MNGDPIYYGMAELSSMLNGDMAINAYPDYDPEHLGPTSDLYRAWWLFMSLVF